MTRGSLRAPARESVRHTAHDVVAVLASVMVLGTVLTFGTGSVTPAAEAPVPTSTETRDGESAQARVDPVLAWSRIHLAQMTRDDKARSLLVLHVAGQDPDLMRASVAPVVAGGAGAGGLILMRDNVPATPDELTWLTSASIADSTLPPVIAIDEEGGEVVRLAYDGFAGADYLRTASTSEVTDAFAGRGALLRSVGVNLNFGIVADVTADPGAFIYGRTLGDDSASAAERVAAAVSAEEASVGSTLKHFPGHGRSAADSHAGIPSTDVSFDEWRATDAQPFAAGISAGASAVMFGHLAYPAVDAAPATFSSRWHEILRSDLGFTGLAVTDDMLMLQSSGMPEFADPYANAVAAVNAGNDALLYVLPADPASVGIDVSALAVAIASGVSDARLDDAAMRMLMFRRALAPDALTWVPPCDTTCLARAVGAGVKGGDGANILFSSAH